MSSPVEDQPKSPLILIIEDDSQMRRYLRTVLTNEGYYLIEATTAQRRNKASRSSPSGLDYSGFGLA